MDSLLGLFAVTAMLVLYALEDHSPWSILAFEVTCGSASIYGFYKVLGRSGWSKRCGPWSR
jgi:hypothetical protein